MPRQRSAPAPARSAAAAASRPKPAASSPPPPSSSSATSSATAAPASSGGWFSRPAAAPQPTPAAPQYTAPPPMSAPPAAAPPAMASSGGGVMSGLIGTVVQGAALGTGSAIAHRAVDSLMGPRTVVHEHQQAPAPATPAPVAASMPPAEGPCGGQVKAFAECMSKNSGDMGACQWYFDAMQQCKLSSA